MLTNDSLFDCYLEELRTFCHFHTDGEDGMTEEQADEVIDYYYNTRSYMFDEKAIACSVKETLNGVSEWKEI